MAQALLNHLGQGRFMAYSAGSSPRHNQQPHPLALETLENAGIRTQGLYSKSWDEFAQPDAPAMDLIITVCDNAAGEVCPVWPGHPAKAHWGYADPSAIDGGVDKQREAFKKTLQLIGKRLELLVNLPPASLNHLVLEKTAHDLANQ
jgi:protein-tyrosine-phosphatase